MIWEKSPLVILLHPSPEPKKTNIDTSIAPKW
jgi:hypothetical protein